MPEDIEMESASPDGVFATDGPESTGIGSRIPRLFIKEMVMRNFKSYAGEQRVGPFHKVRVSLTPTMFLVFHFWYYQN